jgi:hypothetical protein
MPKLLSSEAFVLLANAIVFAGLATIPSLVAGYACYKLRGRQIGTDFSLGKLESVELDRAVLLYERGRNARKKFCANVHRSMEPG